jgi:hypothetical protein
VWYVHRRGGTVISCSVPADAVQEAYFHGGKALMRSRL